MTLQQLVYFLAVAETRHFTRAAELAHVAQPSLSKQIRSLEAELGTALFTRARGNIGLTPAGEALLPLAKRILADVETARLEVQELVGLRRGRVRVGATPSLCLSLLPDVLRRFHDTYPGIHLLVEESGSQDLVRELTRGQLDLALIIVPPEGADPALTALPILHEDLVVASSADDPPPTHRHHLRIAELAHRPLVMFRPGYDLREATLSACGAAGVSPRFAVEGGELNAVLRFVEAGLGVAIVPSMVLRGRPQLRGTPLAPPGISRTIALAHRTDVSLPHAARALRATLLSYVTRSADLHRLAPGVLPLPAPGEPG
ncbi:DNA-binding transcriptional regulator, LysR family [Streptoalloteichus tenebrarius]|uniref:DNA-binding transcriptional regulator, LysR family n=1 Tax=Streptoalloteichus tenebrarius (strain ATCC 17920 / DSM 40477 / JCM 4838 / CBS 697.72 / NBRC 16177 / NCIMB 11028 / NRRL B-12390 / A12253. 1 / ISP 5477) TaxID=1933 RepID=A0ABT1HW24_STRSD|nr:LysR substrate-binding domain-containing protein [Streptoalloteichus tenebrarius]MCP2259701.1 DNA-binding transcriptional regulator, LysR family [Streptoalloteichus tenebrarius]